MLVEGHLAYLEQGKRPLYTGHLHLDNGGKNQHIWRHVEV